MGTADLVAPPELAGTGGGIELEVLPGHREAAHQRPAHRIPLGIEVDPGVHQGRIRSPTAVGGTVLRPQAALHRCDRERAACGEPIGDPTGQAAPLQLPQALVGHHRAPAVGDQVDAGPGSEQGAHHPGEALQDPAAHAVVEHVDEEIVDGDGTAPGDGQLIEATAAGGFMAAAVVDHIEDRLPQGVHLLGGQAALEAAAAVHKVAPEHLLPSPPQIAGIEAGPHMGGKGLPPAIGIAGAVVADAMHGHQHPAAGPQAPLRQGDALQRRHRVQELHVGPVDHLLGAEGLRIRSRIRRSFGCRIPAGAWNRWRLIGTVVGLSGLPEDRCIQLPALMLGHLFELPLQLLYHGLDRFPTAELPVAPQHLAEVIGEGTVELTLDRGIGGRLGFHAGHQVGLGNLSEPRGARGSHLAPPGPGGGLGRYQEAGVADAALEGRVAGAAALQFRRVGQHDALLPVRALHSDEASTSA